MIFTIFKSDRLILLSVNLLTFFLLISGLQGWKSSTSALPMTNVKQTSQISIADLEKSVHQQVNQYRQKLNLPPLTLDPVISEQSRIHSQNMADGKVPFSHDGFESRVKAIAMEIPYSKAAENVAYNQGYSDPVSVAVEGWIKSPGHRQNMEGDFNLTGVGIAVNSKGEYYFTQIFILKR